MNVPASLRSDQVAVMPWIGWQLCTGLDGRNGVDQVAGITGMRTIKRATLHNAYGAHYIENILYQEMTPKTNHPPVRLKDENLNNICLEKPALADYDAFVVKRRKKP